MLRDIKSMNQNIFLTVDTTCPLPRGDRPPTPKGRTFEPPPTIPEDHSNEIIQMENEKAGAKKHHKRSNRNHHHHHRKRSRDRKRHDQSEDIPEWIKAEMEVASKEMVQKPEQDPHKAHSHSKDRKKSSSASENEDHIKRMQKEFELKRKELLLQAENVVRMREEAYNQELFRLQTELEKQKRMREESVEKLTIKESDSSQQSEGRCILQ